MVVKINKQKSGQFWVRLTWELFGFGEDNCAVSFWFPCWWWSVGWQTEIRTTTMVGRSCKHLPRLFLGILGPGSILSQNWLPTSYSVEKIGCQVLLPLPTTVLPSPPLWVQPLGAQCWRPWGQQEWAPAEKMILWLSIFHRFSHFQASKNDVYKRNKKTSSDISIATQ